MFCGSQQNQNHPAIQLATGANNRKIGKALSVLQLASGVTLGLFIAGIVVPSFFRSGIAANQALAGRSLHVLTIAGVTLSFTLRNLASALLGGLFGSLIALAIEFPPTPATTLRAFPVFRQLNWKRFLSGQPDDPSYVDDRK